MHESEKWKWSRSVVSDSSRPHGLQPTRLLCPWDFPGKSTGVGFHCLLVKHSYIKWRVAGENKMAGDQVDVEYLFLQQYMRNTPSETEMHAEHQLRVDRSIWQWKRKYRTMHKLLRGRNWGGGGGAGGNRSVTRTGPALSRCRNWSRGPIPTLGQLSESEEKHLRLTVQHLICGNLNGMRIR